MPQALRAWRSSRKTSTHCPHSQSPAQPKKWLNRSTPFNKARNENANSHLAGTLPSPQTLSILLPPPVSQFYLSNHPRRYQFRSPKYYRGPLHPYQPPPPSDPSSRLFIPGPFSLPRLQQTYTSTLAPDLLTLLYNHHPPGTLPGPASERLRSWEGDSPYFKNRPLRPPRGAPTLNLMRRPITFRNVPTLEKITVHSFVKGASSNSALLHVAGMAIQAITNVRCTAYRAKKSITNFNLRAGRATAVGCELRGEDMWCFLAKVVDMVMPRIKDFRGVSGGSGDNNGNLAFGFNSDIVGSFPEIEINYDSWVLSLPHFFLLSFTFSLLLEPDAESYTDIHLKWFRASPSWSAHRRPTTRKRGFYSVPSACLLPASMSIRIPCLGFSPVASYQKKNYTRSITCI